MIDSAAQLPNTRATLEAAGWGRGSIRAFAAAARVQPMLVLALGLTIAFSVTTDHFLTPFNLSNVLYQAALVGFLAVGMTPLVISGNIDLSVGAIVGMAACLAIKLQEQHLDLSIIIAVSIAAGGLLGALNGLIVEKIGVDSFIVTLAAMIGYRGLTFLYAGDASLSGTDERLIDLGQLSFGPVSLTSLLFLCLVLVFQWVLGSTLHGRNSYAIGGNRRAAVDAGIRVSRHVIVNFALSGLTAALCGVAMAAKLGAATPKFGADYELWAVTAIVLGGTRLRGGKGTALGTFGAVLALATLRNGMDLIHIPPFYVPIIVGAALIVGLLLDRGLSRSSSASDE
jgi:ribose transport system permease protein